MSYRHKNCLKYKVFTFTVWGWHHLPSDVQATDWFTSSMCQKLFLDTVTFISVLFKGKRSSFLCPMIYNCNAKLLTWIELPWSGHINEHYIRVSPVCACSCRICALFCTVLPLWSTMQGNSCKIWQKSLKTCTCYFYKIIMLDAKIFKPKR